MHPDSKDDQRDGATDVRADTAREIARWLRHIDRLDEIPGAKVALPECNPLWDASFAIEREFADGDA